MRSKSIFICLIILLYNTALLSQSISSPQLAQLISEFSNKILTEVRTSLHESIEPTISLTSEAGNSSMPSYGIKMSEPRLEAIYAGLNREQGDQMLLFLLGHEIAHQLQFKWYSNELILLSSCEKRRLNEAQADILAGYFYSRIRDIAGRVLRNENVSREFAVYQNIYKLGDAEFSLGDHPSFKQRRNAFRLGSAFDLANSAMYETDRKQQTYEALNFKIGETLATWSLKVAKQIEHYPLSTLKSVQLLRDYRRIETAIFDDRPTSPFVSYRDTIVNNGRSAIRFFVQYKVKGVDRQTGDESKAEKNGDLHNYEVILQPGESHVFDGSLSWDGMSSSEFVPKMMFMPDNDVLYNAEPVDTNESIVFDDFCPGNRTFGDITAKESETLEVAIDYAAKSAIENFSSIILGPAIEHPRISTEYQSIHQIPGSKGIRILVSKSKNPLTTLDIEFYTGKDELEAESIYQKVDNALSSFYGKKLIEFDLPFEGAFAGNTSQAKFVKREDDIDYYAVGPHASKMIYPRDEFTGYSDEVLFVDGRFPGYHCSFDLTFQKKKRLGIYQVTMSMTKMT
jgi:hypothetical protein